MDSEQCHLSVTKWRHKWCDKDDLQYKKPEYSIFNIISLGNSPGLVFPSCGCDVIACSYSLQSNKPDGYAGLSLENEKLSNLK